MYWIRVDLHKNALKIAIEKRFGIEWLFGQFMRKSADEERVEACMVYRDQP